MSRPTRIMDVKRANIEFYDRAETPPAERISAGDAARERRKVEARLGGAVAGSARTLEVGCHRGWLVCRLVASGFSETAVGMDISGGILKACRELARKNGLDVDLAQGDSERLPFRDGSFDFICGGGFLHHLENEAAFFSEAFRALKPGGALLIHHEPQAFGSKFVQGIVRAASLLPAAVVYLFKKRRLEASDHELGKTYSARSLKEFGEGAGFRMASCMGHSFLHTIHWYLMMKTKPFPALYRFMERMQGVVDRIDEGFARRMLPRKFHYEISAGFIKD